MSDNRYAGQIDNLVSNAQTMRINLPEIQSASERRNHLQMQQSAQTLNLCLNGLEEAISSQQLTALPLLLLVQVAKWSGITALSTTNIISDFDSEAPKFIANVDALHNHLWLAGLISPSVDATAYRSAAGHLVSAMESVRGIIREVSSGLTYKKELEAATLRVTEIESEATNSSKSVKEMLTRSKTDAGKSETYLAEVQRRVSEISQIVNESRSANIEILTLKSELEKWHAESRSHIEALKKLQDSTDERLQRHDVDISSRAQVLQAFEAQIRAQFSLASSGALAEGFKRRSEPLALQRKCWLATAVAAYVGFIGFAFWLVYTTLPQLGTIAAGGDRWIFIASRTVLTIPIGLFIWFTTRQYAQVRRLEESYEFKATVAASFDAYKDLVAKIATDQNLKADAEYAKFIRDTITRIYSEPAAGSVADDEPPHTRVLKECASLVRSFATLERARRGK